MTTPPAERAARGRRIKSITLLLVLVANLLAMLAWTRTWYTVVISMDTPTGRSFPASGSDAAGGLIGLALAGLALLAAIALAGTIVRVVLGVVQVGLGVAMVAQGLTVLIGRDLSGVYDTVSSATGVAGDASLARLITSSSFTAWPVVAVLGGVLGVVAGLLIVVRTRSWPRAGRRYSADTTKEGSVQEATTANGTALADPTAPSGTEPDRIGDWDELSHGQDPTAR
jgi:uncharacterized membrane protein (TIGR02234 family)